MNRLRRSASALLSSWRHELQIAILRRRAAMYRAVLLRATNFERWLLSGNADRGEDALGREEVIVRTNSWTLLSGAVRKILMDFYWRRRGLGS